MVLSAGWFYGTIDEGPEFRIFVENGAFTGRGYYYHIKYSDGDEEWVSPEEGEILTAQATKQRDKKPATAKTKATPLPSSRKTAKRNTRGRSTKGEQEDDEDVAGVESGDDASDIEESGKPNRRKRQKENDTDDDERVGPSKGTTKGQNASRARASRGTTSSSSAGSVRQRGAKHAKKPRSDDTNSESDDDQDEKPEVLAVSETEFRAPVPFRDEDPVWGLTELNASLCTNLDNLIQSKECEFGARSLERMLHFHKRYPSSECRKKLIDVLLYGPTGHDKNTHFPDEHRTLLVHNAVGCLLNTRGMHGMFAADLVSLGWEVCLNQITQPIFAVEGDEQRTNQDAVRRVADSLYVKAIWMELFSEMLHHEQVRCCPSSDSVMRKCLLGEIARTGHTGSRGAVESAVKAYTHLLIKYGHLVVGVSGKLCSLADGPSYKCLMDARAAAECLYRALGKVVSILAWLYSIVESEKMISVSHLIGSLLLSELRTTTFDPTPFLDEIPTLDHWQTIKMKFILGIERELVPQLRPHLADKLSVAEDYNAIFA